MNREIKFRAWNKHENKMINSVAILGIWEKFVTGFDRDYIHNSQDWGNQDDFAYDFELMQFTGLQDKNGKDIYEGDIYHQGDINIKYIVDYIGSGFIGLQVGNKSRAGLEHFIFDIEVIGNIYEHPELLTK